MGLIQQLKSALGLAPREESDTREDSKGQDVAVTVEHDPDTESEDAVKGTETGSSARETGDPSSESATEPAVDAAEEVAEETDTTSETDGAETDAEASATATESADREATDEVDAGSADGDEPTADAAATDDGGSADVQSINGIGPAYAERLGEAGIETVADLADADAASVASESGIAEGRVSTWIEQANE